MGEPHQEQPKVNGSKKMGLKDGLEKDTAAQKRRRKEENQAKREQKAKARKEKQATKAKKAKEREESLRKKGERLTKNQPKIVGWFRKEGLGSRKTPAGGKTGVG